VQWGGIFFFLYNILFYFSRFDGKSGTDFNIWTDKKNGRFVFNFFAPFNRLLISWNARLLE